MRIRNASRKYNEYKECRRMVGQLPVKWSFHLVSPGRNNNKEHPTFYVISHYSCHTSYGAMLFSLLGDDCNALPQIYGIEIHRNSMMGNVGVVVWGRGWCIRWSFMRDGICYVWLGFTRILMHSDIVLGMPGVYYIWLIKGVVVHWTCFLICYFQVTSKVSCYECWVE